MRRRFLIVPLSMFIVLGALIGTARAHVFVAHTNLTIKREPTGPVSSGTQITISGKLTGRPECREGQTVLLLEDGVEVDDTITGPNGSYTFAPRTVTDTTTFQTTFEGSQTGIHPHVHTCNDSSSRILTVKVSGTGSNSTDGSTGEVLDASTSTVISTVLGSAEAVLAQME